jgi:phosphoribosyl-dephospho-CoA transferase
MRAPAVVRRDRDLNWIPIGLRGTTRSERHKGWLSPQALIRRVTPEALAAAVLDGELAGSVKEFPSLQALAQWAPQLCDSGLAWGPTGGVGFALATGLPVLRESSDLDLVVRAPLPLTAQQHDLLQRLCTAKACRIDLQVETGQGGFAFAEWLRGHGQGQSGGPSILLKTAAGPLLIDDPWRPALVAA